jgi:hypothetical protein
LFILHSVAGCACLPQQFFSCFFFWIFFDLHFTECFSLPSARQKALDKDLFANRFFAERSLPSATLGKAFAECKKVFAECLGHSAKKVNPVVILLLRL